MRTKLLIFVLTIAAGLSFANDAFAQRGRWGGGGGRGYYGPSFYSNSYTSPYYYGNWGSSPYYGGSNYAYRPYYYSQPYYSSTPYYSPDTAIYNYSAPQMTYSYSPDATQSQSFYYNPETSPQSAMITVFVPTPETQLWIDNTETKQQGMTRRFSSPSLESGKTFTYTLKARWMQNGQSVERERQIQVQAGQQATADFRTN